MKPSSEHFQIVKKPQNEEVRSGKGPFFQTSNSIIKDFLNNNKLLSLKQLIEKNRMEYTLTVCVILAFFKKGKTILKKNEIVESTKNEIINNPNKIFIFKGNAKEKVDTINFNKRINIFLHRSHYMLKIGGSKENTEFSLNIKNIESEYKSILNGVISLSQLPIVKVQKTENGKINIINHEMIEIKENEYENDEKNNIQKKEKNKLSEIKIAKRRRRRKFINITFNCNKLNLKRKRNDEDKNKSLIDNKMNINSTDMNNNITTNNMINNINNEINTNKIKNNINKFHFNTSTSNNIIRNNNYYNNNNINSNTNNNINNNNLQNNYDKLYLKISNDETEYNLDRCINPLLNKSHKLMTIIEGLRKNPEISKNIIENERKRIENEINIINEEINFKKKEIENKNKLLILLEDNQQLFNKYQTENIKNLSNNLKLLCEEYQDKIKVTEHYKEIIKLTKNNDEHFLIEKYKESYSQSKLLYENIFNKLSVILNEYTCLENIIDILYKDNKDNNSKNSNNYFIKDIISYKNNNILSNNNIFEIIKKFLKSKLDIIDNDKIFNKFIDSEKNEEDKSTKETISSSIKNNNDEENKQNNNEKKTTDEKNKEENKTNKDENNLDNNENKKI